MSQVPRLFIFYGIILPYLQNWSNAQPISGDTIVPAAGGDFSFVVSIQFKKWKFEDGQHRCTGSLISKKHVLTAAQCLNGIDSVDQLEVLAGSSDLKSCNKYNLKSWITFKTWAKIKNKAFSTNKMDNNMAILTLSKEVKERKFRKASFSIKKVKELESFDGQMAGWASPSGPIKLSPIVVSANATILTREGCEDIAGVLKNAVVHVHEEELCAIADHSVMVSKTDSGVPLFYKKNKILGVLSGVCPNTACPDGIFVFTGVEPYKEFIEDVMKSDR